MILHPEIDTAYAVFRIIIFVVMGLCVVGGALCAFLPETVIGKIGSVLAGFVVAGLVFGVWAWAVYPPFDSQYHTYNPITMTVAQTNSRFISDGNNSVSQRFAILATNGQTYGCDDTRCSVLSKGETVTLMCEEEWEANGVPGYVCNWGKVGANTPDPAPAIGG